MALRNIRLDGDPILRKKSREIEIIDDRLKILLDDMVETMIQAEGVGLAAPQVGVLRRAIVLDIGEGPIKMINPRIIEKDGKKIDIEGCLSVPGKSGTVERPFNIKVLFLDENGEEKSLDASDFLARVICHEIDHLNGILYTDKVIEYMELRNEED